MILLLFILILSSCSKTEIINSPTTRCVDTVSVLTTNNTSDTSDTTDIDNERHPITFNVGVVDWDEIIH